MFFMMYMVTVGSMAVYGCWHLRQAFWRELGVGWTWGGGVLLLLASFAPVWLRLLFGRQAPFGLATLAWIWLAWLFWFVSMMALCDGTNLLLGLLSRPWLARFWPDCVAPLLAWRISPRLAVVLGAVLIGIGSLWGTAEVLCLRVKRIALVSPQIPAEIQGYRIVLLSDMHLGSVWNNRLFHRVERLLHGEAIDLLLNAGDFLDGPERPEWIEYLASLEALPVRDGKVAVLGNHDFYAGAEHSVALHRQAGFQVLRDETVQVTPWLWIYGVDDPHGRRRGEPLPELDAPGRGFGILLKHQPRLERELAAGHYDLSLSGHTHGGQIFPFNLLVRLSYGWKTGVLQRDGRTHVYISRGTGFWGPPFRFLSRPEITVFELSGAGGTPP